MKASTLKSVLGDNDFFFQLSRSLIPVPVSALALYNVCLMTESTNFWFLSRYYVTNHYTPMNILMTFSIVAVQFHTASEADDKQKKLIQLAFG